MNEKKLKIVIVDDNEIFRNGMKFYLENLLKHTVIAEYSDGEDVINSDSLVSSDVILMDIEMPKLNGIDAAKNVLWKYPMLKIIAITNFKDKAYLTELIGVGFKGCVFKDDIYNELQKAIDVVLADNIYYPEDINL